MTVHYLIEVPETEDFSIKYNDLQHVEGQLPGSEIVANKKLVLVIDHDLQQIIDDNSLPWTIIAQEGVQISLAVQADIITYMSDLPVVDEQGDITGYTPVTDIVDKLPIWAGRSWSFEV